MKIIEKRFEYLGFDCVVVMTEMGHRCGYVGVGKDHSLYGKSYSYDGVEEEISCHGGLTYADDLKHIVDSDLWYFGFDCAHYDDKPAIEHMSASYRKAYCSMGSSNRRSGIFRSLDFCIRECREIAIQLKEY